MSEIFTCFNSSTTSLTDKLTISGRAECELRLILVSEPLDEVDLLERQLHCVAVLRIARHVRRPELMSVTILKYTLIKYHARARCARCQADLWRV